MPKPNNSRATTKLVNRGPAGLLRKLGTDENGKPPTPEVAPLAPSRINRIAPALKEMIVSIDSLNLDPNNARVHPERNMEAIKGSLALYGQVKPIVVRKKGRVVMAGNGTLAAAKALGWTKIAAVVTEMSEVEAAGYGLADNRTAELAQWDFETVARLDKLISEQIDNAMVGWTADELEVLRAADWTPPAASSDGFGGGSGEMCKCPKCGHEWSA